MRWLSVALAVALAAMGWAHYRVQRVQTHIERIKELLMQSITTEWKDAKGNKHSVNTPRNEGEDRASWYARHEEDVAAAQAIWPPAS